MAVKQRKNKKSLRASLPSKEALESASWEKVKIKGNVISDDGGGYEGLIGLEVLENYAPALVETATAKRSKKDKRLERKKGAKKRKLETAEEDAEESEEKTPGQSPKKKPQKKVKSKASLDPVSIKIEERRKKREKRKAERKEKLKLGSESVKKTPKQQTKKQKAKVERKKEEEKEETTEEEEEEHPPERFALLRPPPAESESETEAPEAVPLGALDVEDLEGWNGLGVPAPILRAMAEKGFKSPTEIQAMTLPAAILGKKDILGAAETGSGKTLAFGIPILAGILELKAKNRRTGIRKPPKVKGKPQEVQPKEEEEEQRRDERGHELTPPPEELDNFPTLPTEDEASESEDEKSKEQSPLYAVILTPTRELAVQVKDHLIAAAKYTGIKVAAIFGGLSVAKQERVLRQCPEIIVATPGRFWELYEQDNPHLRKIDEISFLVIDETDRMVEKGHFEELRSLLKVLNADEQRKQSRQTFVFSATLTLVHDLPDHMQKRNVGKRPKYVKQTSDMKLQSFIEELGISQPKIVDITSSQQTAQTLTECRLICPIDHKDYYLYYFVQRHPGRTIVFCNSIDCVKRLATLFGLLDCDPLPLHAKMIQKQRLKNLERFRDNLNGFLIATDVAARGLDIPNVEHVIHYQVPRTSENYVHRSGRTARANKNGITVMFMDPGEVKNYVKLYKTLERTEDLPLFPVSERYLNAVKERVNLAREVDIQELKLRRSQSEVGWMKKNAEAMEMIIDGFNDDEGSDKDEDPLIIERRRDRVHLATVRTQLKSLLSKTIFPRGFSFKYPTSTGQLRIPETAARSNDPEKNSAVKVMKDAIEDMKVAKKMRNKRRKLA